MKKSYIYASISILCWSTVAVVTKILLGRLNSFQSNNHLFIPDFTHTLGFLWNGMFTMALANTLWVIALQSGETAKISNLAYITPFLALVWTSLILKEPFSIFSLLGLTVIVFGILLQLKDKKQG